MEGVQISFGRIGQVVGIKNCFQTNHRVDESQQVDNSVNDFEFLFLYVASSPVD